MLQRLRESDRLTALDLEGIGFGDAGAAALLGPLRDNAVLTQMGVCAEDFGAAGAEALAGVLHDDTVLRQLGLGFNDPSATGAGRWRWRGAARECHPHGAGPGQQRHRRSGRKGAQGCAAQQY